jgi:cytochrome d ubiquinol oxidase subunit II
MFLQSLPLVFVLCGVVLYAVLAGADFGAGFWQLFAGRGERAHEIREHAHHSMGPVWEANHVWLIFVLTVLWTAYPHAFASITSTLPVPLFIAAVGIVFRGAAYALRSGAASAREAGIIDTVFSLSSILTPFALGCAIGAIAIGRVPADGPSGHLISSWLNPSAAFIGAIAVANGAYLAAVYLAADAARHGNARLEEAFRRRALGAALLTGALAIAGIFVVNADSHALFLSLVDGVALVAVIASALAGLGTIAALLARRLEAARYGAALAVASVLAGWAIARWPLILPNLSVYRAAAGHDTLVCLVVAVIAGGVILFPALGLLFRLTLAGGFERSRLEEPHDAPRTRLALQSRLVARLAAAALIAGVALLTFADAAWAHAVGVVCLFGFGLAAFAAVTVDVLPWAADTGPPTDASDRQA